MDRIEAAARKFCELNGISANSLEPGDAYGIDGTNAKGDPCHFLWRHFADDAAEILAAADAVSEDNTPARIENALQAASGGDHALAYAERLAKVLVAKHYPEATDWKPLSGDMYGLLSQIDNMATGLVRRAAIADLSTNINQPAAPAQEN